MSLHSSFPRSGIGIVLVLVLVLVLLAAGLVVVTMASDAPASAPASLTAAQSGPCVNSDVASGASPAVSSPRPDASPDQGSDIPDSRPLTAVEGCQASWPPVEASTVPTAASATSFTVEARELSFSPSELTIPASGTSTIVLHDSGALAHNFTVDELRIQIVAPPGRTGEATLLDPAPGTYQFYCSISGHKEAGMVGTLIVR